MRVGGEVLERVGVCRYLGMDIGEEGGMKEEMDHRVAEGMRAMNGLREVWRGGELSRRVKKWMFDKICVPVVMYGCETWVLNAKARKKLEVFEMKGLRMVCELSRRDRVRNVRIREMCEWENGLVRRAKKGVMRWFGHVVRMEEGRLPKRVMESEGVGDRRRGRPKRRWMDGVREILEEAGMSEEEGRVMGGDRGEWKRWVRGIGGGLYKYWGTPHCVWGIGAWGRGIRGRGRGGWEG